MQKFIIATLFVLAFFFICGATALAANKTFTGPGNFSDATKWGGTLPVAGDNLRINGTSTFDNAANNLTYGSLDVGRNSSGTLNWPAGGTNILNVTAVSSSQAGSSIDMTNGGTLQIRTSWTTTNQTFTPGAGTIVWNVIGANSTLPAAITTYNNLTITATGRTASLGVATTLNGNLLISAGTLSVSGSNFALNVKGNFTNNGTFTQGSGTVTLNGTAAQTIGGTTVTTFNNLTISNTNAAVLANTNFSVAGTLTVNASATLTPDAGVVVSGAGTLTGSGTVQVTRIIATADFSSQYTITTKTLTNLTVEYAGAGQVLSSLTYGSAGSGGLKVSGSITGASNTATVGGVFTVTGTFTPTSGTITMNNSSSIVNSGGTLTFSNLTIAASATVSTSSSFSIAGTLTVNTSANFSPSGGTITMTGGSISNSGTLAFNGLTISGTTTGSGNFSIGGTMTVNGTFTPAAADIISGGGTLTGSGTVQITRITATADFSSQYTITNKTLSNLTVEYAGASTQTVSALTYGTLKISNSNGVTLAGSTTVNGALTLTSGNITTVSFAMIIGSSGIVSHTNGHIVGNLRKEFASGMQSFTFDVGDATNYTPVAIASFNVTTPGNVTAKTTSTEHPNVGTSGINSAKSVNRFWTLTAGGGIAFTTYDATFSFVSTDVDSSATAANFVVRRFDGTNWFATTSGTKTATSTQATGISSLSDFAIGEQIIDHYAVSAASSQTAGIAFLTTVTAQDILNETVTSDNNTVVTMSGSTGNVQFDSNSDGMFGDNTKALTAGTFTISTKDNIAETINITATDGNSKTGTRTGVVINPGTVTQLAFIQQPTDTVAGTVISPSVTVQLKDTQGNNVPTAGVSITMSLSSGTGVLSGTTPKTTNASGLATFSDLSINLAGSKNLTASSTGLTSAVSNSFTISAGTATKVVFVQQPSDTTAGATISPAVTVQLQDVSGNNVSTSGVSITMSLSSGTGVLSGTTSKTTNASGLATFSDLSINLAGSKNLTASSDGLTSAVSNAFTISVGTATKVVFVQQPSDTTAGATISPAVSVQLQDVSGNNVSTAGVSVAMSLSSGTGILSGTTPKTTNASGLATFSDLSINLAGSKNLTASSDGLTSAVSNAFTISVGTATKVRVETAANGSGTVVPSQSIVSGSSITVYAITRDASDNFVANAAADAWSLENITGGVVSGDIVPGGDNKSAVFTGHFSGTAQIKAMSGSLATTNSGTLTVTAGVSLTSPANNETGVAINRAITATFTETMDDSTITTATFTVSDGSGNISGAVSSIGTTTTFTPLSNMSPSTTYTATITTGVKNLAGIAMASNYTWRFTTGTVTDTTPPTVSSTSPANGATGVAINTAITATFSEAMSVSTITTATFTVDVGGSVISGTVSYNTGQKKATFTPSSNLSNSTAYTAMITTGVKDEAGNATASDYHWSFTTASGPDTTPPTVSSTSPINGATGVAVSTTITATFSEEMDAATITTATFTVGSGSGNVSGTVSYNSGQKTATFTPSGNLSNSTAYSAGITTGVKDVAGNAMASDYHWSFTTASGPDTTPPAVSSTSPLNGATGVAVSTTITATFSEEMDAATITTAAFTVGSSGGNVSGTVSYNSGQKTATFTPSGNLSNSTVYSAMITTGVKDVADNAMVTAYTWGFTTVSVPVPIEPPFAEKFMIISTSPLNGDTDVRIDTTVSATFSMYINGYTLTTGTFKLSDGDNEVYGSVTTNGATATFTPSESLAYNTKYSATITTGAQAANWAGTTLDSNYTWSFTTIMDTEPPTVISISPAIGATDVSLDSVISVTFSEEMDASTITTDTFDVSVGSNKIDGTISYNGTTATLTPSNNLLSSTTYTVEITTDVKDLAGNAMASHYHSSFTTISGPDITPPTVVSTSPANGATGVLLDSIISVTFSEEMDASTITTDTFDVSVGSNEIDGTISYNSMTATLTPSNNLLSSTTYTVEITTDVKDLAGNALASHYHSSFTTVSLPITPMPTPTQEPTPTLTPVPTPLPSPVNEGVVFGKIYVFDEEPLKEVTVTITRTSFSDSTETNEDGYYEFRDLAAGDYTLTYEKEGYQTQTRDINIGEGEELDLGTIIMKLIVKGKIYGYVVNRKGNPIESVRLSLKGKRSELSKALFSDQNGYFEFTDLEADTYVIILKKRGYKRNKQTVKLEEGEEKEIEIVMKKK